MTPQIRFVVIIAVIVLSSGYGILVVKDETLARTIALGYIAVMLTILMLLKFWKKS